MFSPLGSIVLKALIQALSFLQTSSVFYILHWLDSDIGEVVVFLLKVSVQASLDPIGWSFAKHFSHVGTESIV